MEHTNCLHDPQLQINEQRQELLYLNYLISGNDAFAPQTIPHIVKLDTHEVTALPVSGTIVNILSVSPDWNQIAFLVDRDPQARSGTFWPPGASSVTTYVNPHFLIYDRRREALIYEKAFRPSNLQSSPLHEPYSPPFGLLGFEWLANGWHAVVRQEGELPLLVEAENSEIRETRFQNNIPIGDEYYTSWSADGQKLLIRLGDHSAYVIDSQRPSVMQILLPTDQPLSIEWDETGAQLLVMTPDLDRAGLKRWLIDLPS